MKRRRLSAAEMADFSAILPRPDYIAQHTKKPTKCMTNISPHGFMVTIPQSPSNQGCAILLDALATTTAANEEIFAFPNTSGRDQPFLLLYLPCWMGKGLVSSVHCRPGVLIVSCMRTGNNRRDAIGLYQQHFDGYTHCFITNQQKVLNAQKNGGWERQNATSKRRLERTGIAWGDRWVAIHQFSLHVFHSCTHAILLLPESPYGQRIVATG